MMSCYDEQQQQKWDNQEAWRWGQPQAGTGEGSLWMWCVSWNVRKRSEAVTPCRKEWSRRILRKEWSRRHRPSEGLGPPSYGQGVNREDAVSKWTRWHIRWRGAWRAMGKSVDFIIHVIWEAIGWTEAEEEQDPLYVQKMTVAALWKWAGHEGNSGGRNMN